jgi:hypothetical protein
LQRFRSFDTSRVNITPTRLTASLAGAWGATTVTVIEVLETNGSVHVPDAVAALAGFFIPVALFVIGTTHLQFRSIRQTREWFRSAGFWADMKQGWIRMMCWFGGAFITSVVLSVVVHGTWPV